MTSLNKRGHGFLILEIDGGGGEESGGGVAMVEEEMTSEA